jgi:predicted transglutaminase-like cysteine proteinase
MLSSFLSSAHMTHHRLQKIALLIVFTVAIFAGSVPAIAGRNSYFNMNETRSENLKPFPKWTGTVGRFKDQKQTPDNECDKARYHPCVIVEWKAMLDSIGEKPFRDQIETINDWANEHPYIVDQLNWGMEDFWETPYEFMSVNGDCEDYAIAKYYSLRALGVPEDRMRVIIVQDFNLGGIIHAILGVYDEEEKLLILDNQIEQIMPALKIYHYRPIYGVNESWWWAYYPKG